LKILFLNPGAGLGGAERALLEMIASLREEYAGCEAAVILGDQGPLAAKLQALDVRPMIVPVPSALATTGDAAAGGPAGNGVSQPGVILRLTRAAPAIAGYVARLRNAISHIAPDVVHTNGFKMHLMGAWAAPRITPVVWHLHDFVTLRPFMPRLLSLNLHRCARIIANSHSVADDIRAALGRISHVQTVYNAVNLSNFTPEGPRLDLDALARMAPPISEVVRVGLVATTARWKGHEIFLQALAMLPNARIRGYVIGGPIYRTAGSQYSLGELRQMASSMGLDGRVGFTGFVDDSAAAIRALDIVVHASVSPEPFGLAIAEAFACGRAVIASRGGGAQEIIHEAQDALAHRPGDAADLAASLARLAADANLRLALGIAARKTAVSSFSRARLAHDLMRIYGAVTQSGTKALQSLG
jgi:glycosyltransferase involved in cell wall biosynthesis